MVLFHDQQEACVVRTERPYQLLDGCREGDGRNPCIQEVMHRLLLEPREGSFLESFLGHDTDNSAITFDRQHREPKIHHYVQGFFGGPVLGDCRGMWRHDIANDLVPLGMPRGYRGYNVLLCSLSGCSISQDGCCCMDPTCSPQRSKQLCDVEQAVTASENVERLGCLVDEEQRFCLDDLSQSVDDDREVADVSLCVHDGKCYLCSSHRPDLCIVQRSLESSLLLWNQVGGDIAGDHGKTCPRLEQIGCLFDVECCRLGEQRRARILIDAKCKKCGLVRVHGNQLLAERGRHKRCVRCTLPAMSLVNMRQARGVWLMMVIGNQPYPRKREDLFVLLSLIHISAPTRL